MPRTQSWSDGQVNTVLVSQVSLHWYSQVLLELQTHSPGHLSGAVVAVQSQGCWQGPPSVEAPQENANRLNSNDDHARRIGGPSSTPPL